MDFAHFLLHVLHILRLNRAGWMVGEGAIKFKVKRHKLAREIREDARHDQACHTVARVDDYLKWLDLAYVDEREGVRDKIVEDVALGYCAFAGGCREIAAYG